MKKEDMMRRILRSIESDFFKASRSELDVTLKAEWQRLSQQTYSEIELLYYSIV